MNEIVAYTKSLEFILFSGLFFLLCCGVVTDIKSRQVSNKIVLGVLLLSVPLINWNMANIGFWNFVYLGAFVVAHFRLGMGAADLKMLFSLLFVFKDVGLFAGVVGALFLVHLVIEHYRTRVPLKAISLPYAIPITVAFSIMVGIS